jgi:hypothetical protein|tara:strand:- start:762 stop:1043 length:282 start_codon:yes stop_codon:yes gene_type:complete
MIVRKPVNGDSIFIHKNSKPNMQKTLLMKDGSNQVLTYPNSKKYFLSKDGVVVKKSDSFKVIEEEFIALTDEERIDIVKHKLINGVIHNRSDL